MKPEDENVRPGNEHKSTIPVRLWVWWLAVLYAGMVGGLGIMGVGEKTGDTDLVITGAAVVLGTICWMLWRIYRHQLPVMLNYLPDTSNDRFCFDAKNTAKAIPFGIFMAIVIFVRGGTPVRLDNLMGLVVGTFLVFVLVGFWSHFTHRFLRWRATRWQEKHQERSGEE